MLGRILNLSALSRGHGTTDTVAQINTRVGSLLRSFSELMSMALLGRTAELNRGNQAP
jgi:hypothetical protein